MALITKLITGILFGLTLFPALTFGNYFSDIPGSHQYSEAINYWYQEGVIEGYSNGEFKPTRTITREEVVKLIELTLEESSDSNFFDQEVFPDVPSDRWSFNYISNAYYNGVIEGYPDGFFKPKKTVNFAEALKIILESHRVDLNEFYYNDLPLIHMDEEDWYAPYFTYAYHQNLINPNKYYHPKQEMNRGEFADILYRLVQQKNGSGIELAQTGHSTSDEYTITIPKLNIINLKVNFADLYNAKQALEVLKNGLGHYLAPPDEKGKMIIFGHSSGYNWDPSAYKQVLVHINSLKPGDRIYINYKEKGYIYEMQQSEIMPAHELTKIIDKNYQPDTLAIYTCWPPNSVSHRYVIYAVPINQ